VLVDWAPGERPERLCAVLDRAADPAPERVARVAAIVARVRREGDAALVALARELDGVEQAPGDLRVDPDRLAAWAGRADPLVVAALRRAADNIRRFHESQVERGFVLDGPYGSTVGQRVSPLARAGLYVPGGTAAYPSSVLMNTIPAKVAGVPRIVAVTPPRTLEANPAVAAALRIAGLDEVYAVGGAQAVAALAYGTQTVPRVDKVVGPGNAYVATAKRLVFGAVGIDSFAGPSEVVVVADGSADPEHAAADLLAQAEHDPEAAAVAVVWDRAVGEEIARAVARRLDGLPREEIAAASLARYGAVFVCAGEDEAVALVELLAPEHVELLVRDPDALAERVRTAGALFLGASTPEPVGDYLAGPNHVLPTSGTARFSSGLGVYDFVRRTSLVRYSERALREAAEDIVVLARAEGLEAHARSVLSRLGPEGGPTQGGR